MANTQITAGLTYGSGSKKPKKKKMVAQNTTGSFHDTRNFPDKFDPRPYREVYDDEKGEWVRKLLPQNPPKKKPDFPSRQKEIDAENRQRAKARAQLEKEMDYGPGTGSQWPRWHHKHPDNR